MKWYLGALGELRVGRLLGRLGSDWRVLHAVPHGEQGADIDHLVIGPPGVFTINTTNHAGHRVWPGRAPLAADGQCTTRLRAAEREARHASRFLTRASGTPVVASPLIVLVDAAGATHGPTPVPVLTAARLVRHLRALPSRLEADAVATIARAAEEWTTWRPFGVDLPAHTDPDAAFERLRAEVDRARGRRLGWAVAVAGGALLALLVPACALLP